MLRNLKTGDKAAKIQLNFEKIGTFDRIFSTTDAFRKAGNSNIIYNTLWNNVIVTKYTFKKTFCYFLGIAQINLRPFYIENRGGNVQVKLGQAVTLKRTLRLLYDRNV